MKRGIEWGQRGEVRAHNAKNKYYDHLMTGYKQAKMGNVGIGYGFLHG